MYLSKILSSVIGGLILTVGSAFAFTETGTLQNATKFIQEAQKKIVRYKENENTLVQILDRVQNNANSKIDKANEVIANLENNVMTLQTEIRDLELQIAQLEEELNREKALKEDAIKQLFALRQIHQEKLVELDQAKEDLNTAYEYINEADQEIAELEKEFTKANREVQKANELVKEHGEVVDEAEAATENLEPMNDEEIEQSFCRIKRSRIYSNFTIKASTCINRCFFNYYIRVKTEELLHIMFGYSLSIKQDNKNLYPARKTGWS